MAAVFRQPLAPRPVVSSNPLPSVKPLPPFILKRARSPDHATAAAAEHAVVKRTRTQSANAKENVVDKQERRAERDAREAEFRAKYTKAFPSWTFYFDTTDAERKDLTQRVQQLDGHVASFFSNKVTHLITNRPIPPEDPKANKENTSKSRNASLRSPIKLKGLPEDASAGYENIIKKAKQFGAKVWEPLKLDSVLKRCGILTLSAGPSLQPMRSLNSLLESEKRFGTTTERDPSQRRHDFRYFSKGSYFVLVEDINQEVATIAANEYVAVRTAEGELRPTWPVPYCHPGSRGPFIEYNQKEERKREKMERLEREREIERAAEIRNMRVVQMKQRKQNDLRRTVSLSNLHRNIRTEDYVGVNGGDLEESAISGWESNTYIAASGNSMSIASTAFGTTSMSAMGIGSSTMSGLGIGNRILKGGHIPAEVMTSRRVGEKEMQEPSRSTSISKTSASSAMMPPPDIPNRSRNLLRKCKSTNTLRIQKRDEKMKPGYCESCRNKFEDFKAHVRSRRHQKFATTDANFAQLDVVLQRLRRRTKEEVEQADLAHQLAVFSQSPSLVDDDETMHPSSLPDFPDAEQIEDGQDYVDLNDDEEEL